MSDVIDPAEPTAKFPDLAGRVAVVSGTSRGIGIGIAEVLGSQGMRLVLAARSAEKGSAVADRLSAAGVECIFVPADLATPAGAQEVFDAAVRRFGRIHLLVNNAAKLSSRSILELDEDEYRQSFEGNVRMVYGPSRLVARHMVEAGGGGNIIHISSVGGLRAHRGLAGYDASKGAIDALTRSMALDLAAYCIRVNTVAPGATDRTQPPRPAPPPPPRPVPREGRRRRDVTLIPLQRAGTPHEVGWAVAFLASDVAAYVTGQVFYVDGGLVAQLVPPGIWV